jgi:hypothetical protein
MAMAPTPRLRVARPFTTLVFNRMSRPLAGHLPGFGILEYRGRKSGRTIRLVDPQLFVDPTRRSMASPVRFFLGLMRVTDFLRLSPAPAQ